MSTTAGARAAFIAMLAVVAVLILYRYRKENLPLGSAESSTVSLLRSFLTRTFGGIGKVAKNGGEMVVQFAKLGKNGQYLRSSASRLTDIFGEKLDDAGIAAERAVAAENLAKTSAYKASIRTAKDLDELSNIAKMAGKMSNDPKLQTTFFQNAADFAEQASKSKAAEKAGPEAAARVAGEAIEEGSGGKLNWRGFPKDKVKKWEAIKTAAKWTAAGIGTAAMSLFLYEEIKSLVTDEDDGGGDGGGESGGTAGGTAMTSLMVSGGASALVTSCVVVCLVIAMVAMKKKSGGNN